MVILSFFMLSWLYKSLMHMVYPLKYEKLVSEAASKYKIEKELIFAIIKCESGFKENARSSANAQGLMQITPETFKWLSECYTHEQNLSEHEIQNPKANISYGTLFISILLKKYKNEKTALCAYNAGMTVVDRWLSDGNLSPDGLNLKSIPYKETRKYVKRVNKAKKIYKNLYFKN